MRLEAYIKHKDVLYIDEIKLNLPSQQHLLTAIQEKASDNRAIGEELRGDNKDRNCALRLHFGMCGKSECVEGTHPALRSSMGGYGHEIYI